MEGDFGMNDLIIKAMELLSQELNELREDVHALMEQQHVNKITKNSAFFTSRMESENRW